MSGAYNQKIEFSRDGVHEGKFSRLWPTPCSEFVCRLPNINEICETVKHVAYKKKEKLESAQKNNDVNCGHDVSTNIKKGLYESDFGFLQEKDNPYWEQQKANHIRELEEWFKVCIRDFYGISFDKSVDEMPLIRMKESWVHITNDGGYHGPHHHPNCSICGNFYVDIGESSISNPKMNGVNKFYPPLFHPLTITGYDYHCSAEIINPQNYKLCLFPPNLLHDATPYTGKSDRIILAFNAIIGEANLEPLPDSFWKDFMY